MSEAITITPTASSEEEDCVDPSIGEKRDHAGEKKQQNVTTRITAEQKKACIKFFDDAQVFNRNTKLPRAGGMSAFDEFLVQQGLTRGQAGTQFKRWKRERYEFYGEVFDFCPKMLRNHLESRMTSHEDLIINVVDKMLSNVNNCGTTLVRYPQTVPFYKLLKVSDDATNPFFKVLRKVLETYITLLVDLMPNKAKLCGQADEKFFDSRMLSKNRLFEEFYTIIESFEFPEDMKKLEDSFDKKRWKILFFDLEDMLHFCWCRDRFNVELPTVQIAKEGVIGSFARPMVYFTAGVVLRKIGNKSKTTFNSRKEISAYICDNHVITPLKAQLAGLPTEVCEKRNNDPFYASSGFFEFICIVESTFIVNATLEMMMAYCDGSLFNKIKDTLINDKGIFADFKTKLRLSNYDDEAIQKVLVEMLTTYRNIRSRWFINNVNGQRKKSNQYDKSTRENVKVKGIVAVAKEEAISDIKVKLQKSEAALKKMYEKANENIDQIDD